jgi:IclR family KDG regulon transcriptional repressor
MNSSIQKAFKILSFVAENPQKMSLSEMSRALAMNKTTLFRFLQTLESLHLLQKKNNSYVPGIKLFELGSKVPVKQLIVEKAHPILVKLTEEVNETVNLGELNNNQILYLDKCESKRSLQIQTSIGSYISLHATALGKAALSILPESERNAIISRLDLVKGTKNTIADPQKLRAYIEDVNKRGYSLDIEELEVGMHCVAVPLSLPEINFFGAISFAGPSVRFTWARMAELAEKLKETVTIIKEAINLGGE